ncbi:MAG: hypothetical protein H6Q06_2298 [Acidobacteria bacterium]|nr:hypothetical protein [Acidobacteriota bacterium]
MRYVGREDRAACAPDRPAGRANSQKGKGYMSQPTAIEIRMNDPNR